ncbi:hypothetical protein [Desulfotignum balticum]|uniref:hypothetical protein n=1 Tax=Desulfotignum balticum TaxID=115781 RepID=UPI0003FA2FC7|nr:hypothetical protein [Desulfotignum balticum]
MSEIQKKPNVVPISESPLNLHTGYKYHSQKKYPALVFKVAGKLLVDMDEYYRMVRDAQKKNIQSAKRLNV